MRVLVCGGREFNDREFLFRVLDGLEIDCIIEGGSKGADTLAWSYSKRKGIPRQTFNAEWSKYRRAAGPQRNQRMLDEGKPDLVVAFPGGRGTDDMVRRAKRAGVKVMEAKQ